MNVTQRLAIALIGVGFVVAVAAGLYFSLRVQAGASLGEILPQALAVFVIVFPVMGFGLYRYSQANRAEPAGSMSDHVMLLDYLRSAGTVTIAEAADHLNLPVETVYSRIRELIELDLFCGWWNTNADTITLYDCREIRTLQACVVCGSALQNASHHFTCTDCGTDYFSVV